MIHDKHHYYSRHSRPRLIHSRAGCGGNPVGEQKAFFNGWIPACAGMTGRLSLIYITICMSTLAFTPAAQASNLGRLFFTPEQRTQLDHARARNATADGGRASVLTINGIVQKHGGPRTVWINGVAQPAGNSNERSPDAQPVAVPGKSQPVKIKVGQKLLLEQSAPQSTIETDK